MARASTILSVATLLCIAVGCGSSTPSAPSTTPLATTLHGEVSDPAGDSPSDPRVAVSSDLVHATADVTSGNITFVVQFVPGTLDRQMTRVVILLDTDQSAATGIQQNDGMGADYALELVSSEATIRKANPVTCAASQGCFDVVRSEQVTAVPDGMQMTMSLANLGNASGRMTFKLHTYVATIVGQTQTSIVFDSMPDDLLSPGRVQ